MFDWNLAQKMAQRDLSQVQELLQITCLMTWLAPKLESLLGGGPALEKIKDMWSLGCLGLKNEVQAMLKTMYFSDLGNIFQTYCGFQIPLYYGLYKIEVMIFWLFPSWLENRYISKTIDFVLWNSNSAVLFTT